MSSLTDVADLLAQTRRRLDDANLSADQWVRHRLGEHLWSKQQQVAQSVQQHRRTAVKSCHGVGKSFTAARLTCWWIDTHPPGEAFVVTTAPTAKQVEAVLWREINRASRKANPPLPGRILTTEWKLGNELVAFGRKPADHDPHGFQGIHARYVLVVLDEACGIPEQLWIATTALMTNDDCRVLAIGNPDDPTSNFYRVCQPGSGWNVLSISAYDSPNFTGEAILDDLRSMLVNQAFLDDLALDVGVGSPIWMSKALGEFPEDSDETVIRASTVTRCRQSDQQWSPEQLLPVELGVDVGGSEHGDRTVIRERRGVKAGTVWRLGTSDSNEVEEAVVKAIVVTGASRVKIDSIGVGWGVAGGLERRRRAGEHAARIVKVNVGEKAHRDDRFPRLRDEIWWEVGRGLSERGGWDLEQIDDRTAADLTAPHWAPDPSGRIKVEPKDKTHERLGRSPDDADALLLAFYAAPGVDWHFPDDGQQRALDGRPLGEPVAPGVVRAPSMPASAKGGWAQYDRHDEAKPKPGSVIVVGPDGRPE